MKVLPYAKPAQSVRGRPRAFDEEQFLDGAIELFRRRGFSGVSISDITAATGLTTGSVYKAYKDKEGVFAKALARYVALRQQQLNARLAEAKNGKAKIAQLLRDYVELSQGRDGKLGCMVVAGVTHIDQLGAVGPCLTQQLAERRAALLALIEQGQQDGSIASNTDARITAEILLALLQGMRVVGKAEILTADGEAFVAQALKLLG
ncbi:TetR/AcrR family transcriptional regulator [Gallaecimonas mangrovi]|uniref:TetR/AcrR family transcriptional regulator n=1 Tax=Gallaecimonas mangrovi TaxID=2291597 RepID=UPI000E208708|nr:TetR/AcrR family transcriptional regulator [Gallaecimonas mangrovi]